MRFFYRRVNTLFTKSLAMQKTSLRQKIALIILGLFLCVILLEIGMRIGGGIFLFLQEYRNIFSLKQKGILSYKIMCLGESTTFFGGGNSYPAQLERILNERNIGIRFKVINEGTAGANSAIILSKLNQALEKHKPNMVIVMIGVNDIRGNFMYEDTLSSEIRLFLEGFRIYKLTKLIWWHIVSKVGSIEKSKLRDKRKNIEIQKDSRLKANSDIGKNKYPMLGEPSAVKENSENSEIDYFYLGYFYNNQRLYEEAELMFKKAIEMNPKYDDAYAALGDLYMNQGKFYDSELMLKKAIELNPNNVRAYLIRGNFYNKIGLYKEAEVVFEKAIEINAKNFSLYYGIGESYLNQRRYKEAEEVFKKAIEINPKDSTGYNWLGYCFQIQGRNEEAKEILNKSMKIDPNNFMIYKLLGVSLMHERKYTQAEEVFKTGLKLVPSEFKTELTIGLFDCYKAQGKNVELKKMYESFVHNYLKIKDIIIQKGIKFVCVQYPMRSIEPLKKLFVSSEGIIFVDNEKVFKKALEHSRHEDYFIDNFAGDFGHCTPQGNRLLSENIASVIIKEYFSK